MRTVTERFWSKVAITDGCWEWTGSRFRNGYGSFSVSSMGQRLAHRVSYLLANGPIPDGKHVLHTCDNPPCVRPSHLWLGSAGDNIRDSVSKGRWHGSMPGHAPTNATLTRQQVETIRARYGYAGKRTRHVYPNRQTDLAAEFGVTQATIGRAVRGHNWR